MSGVTVQMSGVTVQERSHRLQICQARGLLRKGATVRLGVSVGAVITGWCKLKVRARVETLTKHFSVKGP